MRERESNLDLLRTIAALMVIIIHVSAGYVLNNMANPNLNFTIANFFDSFSTFCVPIFVMLSGAFLLSNAQNASLIKFYRKTFNKLIIPTFYWSLFYVLYSLVSGLRLSYITGSDYYYLSPLLNWLDGRPFYHLWYLYMILGIYLMTPLLVKILSKVTLKTSSYIGIILVLIGMILNASVTLLWPFKFINYLGYFVLGYVLKKKFEVGNTNRRLFMCISISSALSIFILTELIVRWDLNLVNQLYFYDNLSPLVIVGSLATFSLFLNLKDIPYNKMISHLAKHSFNIYIIHAVILDILSTEIIKLGLDSNLFLFIPIMSIFLLITSFGISVLLNKTFNRVRAKISNKKRNVKLQIKNGMS